VLEPECEVRNSVVGAGAHIGKGARVSDSVIGPRAVIGDGAVVERSVALGGVAASHVVRDTLIAPA
jgi:ADP-glucose pyrophosphorylase